MYTTALTPNQSHVRIRDHGCAATLDLQKLIEGIVKHRAAIADHEARVRALYRELHQRMHDAGPKSMFAEELIGLLTNGKNGNGNGNHS